MICDFLRNDTLCTDIVKIYLLYIHVDRGHILYLAETIQLIDITARMYTKYGNTTDMCLEAYYQVGILLHQKVQMILDSLK